MRFWVSWNQQTEDYRPLTFPLNEGVLGWWCSGQSMSEWTLCALISAANREAAADVIKKDWPELREWRFIYEKSDKWLPGDRFPLKDWMLERFRKAGNYPDNTKGRVNDEETEHRG